ncbi:MAG: polysaccharide pyruvyl transferase family protein [Prevotella sp.]|nr:polysaccharide pyruvyl transferase family protein [Prevotella sp.]
MKTIEKIQQLRKTLEETLASLIVSDYIYIDLPYHSNIGDTLIWKGTETFLSCLPYKCILRASFQTFTFPNIDKEVIILMHGGGNFGDLYTPHNKLRRDVVEHYPDNKIIVLPQTVYYEGARNACSDAKIFRKHSKLTICARDRYSYYFLKLFRFSKNILLIPDMAFCIDREELHQMAKPLIGKDLLFKRVDKEETDLSQSSNVLTTQNYDISDWPMYEGGDPLMDKLYSLIAEGKNAEADEYAVNTYLPERVRVGVELISKYDRVFSNRLHGAILAILLGKETFILDNSYGKNSQYYNTWLKDTDNIQLLHTRKPLRAKRKLRFFLHWIKMNMTAG